MFSSISSHLGSFVSLYFIYFVSLNFIYFDRFFAAFSLSSTMTSFFSNSVLSIDVIQNASLFKVTSVAFGIFLKYLQSWPKVMAKTVVTPQAMYNQLKRPSAGSVSELYYIYRKT